MMNKKPTISIIIFAALIMLIEAVSLPSFFNPQQYIEYYVKPFGIAFFVLNLLTSASSLLFAINILRLKEWAREYFVKLCFVLIVITLIVPFAENKDNKYNSIEELSQYAEFNIEGKNYNELKSSYREKLKELPEYDRNKLIEEFDFMFNDAVQASNHLITIVFVGISLLINGLFIFFFIRLRIKSQFS